MATGIKTALEQYHKMLSSFSPTSIESGVVNYNREYPDDYCGAYFNRESGKLTVCLTDISEQKTQKYLRILEKDSVEFVKHTFSFKYLLDLSEAVKTACEKNRLASCFYISESKNLVVISPTSNDNKALLSDFLASVGFEIEAVDFVSMGDASPCAIYANPADRVYRWNNGSRGSSIGTIGFNAVDKSGAKGFVTVNHLLWYNNYPDLGIYECQCGSISSYISSPATDSCFVPFSSEITGTSGTIDNSNLYGNTKYNIETYVRDTDDLLENGPVVAFGKTSGIYEGTVSGIAFNYTFPNEPTQIPPMPALLITVDKYHTPDAGDSGGPALILTDDTSNPKKGKIAGILSANWFDGNSTTAAYQYVMNILPGLDLQSIVVNKS